MYKLFLTVRYLARRRIAYFAVAAVTLCVWMVVIVMSVMGGFLDMVKARARGLLGDVIIDNHSYQGFPLYQEFIDEITQWPEVVAATPVIYTAGLLAFPNYNSQHLVQVVGIRLHEVYEVNAFEEGLFYEKYYPGTTSFEPTRQPVIGFDPASGTLRLPEPLRSALAAARKDPALSFEDAADPELAGLYRQTGQAPIPGNFVVAPETGPLMIGEPYPGLIVGLDVVAKRRPDGTYERWFERGELATLTVQKVSLGGSIDPQPIRQPFRYVDDSHTGIHDIDVRTAYCDFSLLQRLLQMGPAPRVDAEGNETGVVAPGRCSQIQIRIAPGVDADALTTRLEATYRTYADRPGPQLDGSDRDLIRRVDAVTWEQSQMHVIAPVEKEKQLMLILFGIISLVAVVLVMCILYMIALAKTRDIGIIKSIGGSSAGVAAIFVAYGAAVGVVGAVLGGALGSVTVVNLNGIQDLLAQAFGWRMWDPSVYSFDRIPDQVKSGDLAGVMSVAVVASVVGSLAAAWRAGRMTPVEALRHE